LSSTIKPDVYLKKLTIVVTKNPLLDEHKQHWTIIIKKPHGKLAEISVTLHEQFYRDRCDF